MSGFTMTRPATNQDQDHSARESKTSIKLFKTKTEIVYSLQTTLSLLACSLLNKILWQAGSHSVCQWNIKLWITE